MALVRATKNVYLGAQGFHEKDEEFDYDGPENHNLEPLEKSAAEVEDENDTTYHAMTRDQLQAELEMRGIDFKPGSKDATYRKLLEADDDAKAA